MTTPGVPDPPDSPIGTDIEDNGSQYRGQHGSGARDSGEGQMDDQLLKVVSATVKGLLAELLPQLLKPQQGNKGNTDDKKGRLEEKYFRRVE
eukprot:407042-Karenia_brevis.AAC.1